MVNFDENGVCTTRTQSMHNPYIRFAVNEHKQKVNWPGELTICINQLSTSEVLL